MCWKASTPFHVRHHYIANHEAGAEGFELLQAFLAVVGQHNIIASVA